MSDLPSILISLGIAAVALLAGALIGKRIVARTGRYIGTGAFMVGLVLALAALNWAARLGLQYGSQVEYGVDCGIIFLFGVIVGLNSPPNRLGQANSLPFAFLTLPGVATKPRQG